MMNEIESSRKRSIFPILWIMFFNHTGLNVYIPVFTLVFFDLQSNIFSPDTSYVVRSFWYGICLGLPRIGNLFFAPILSSLSDEFGRKNALIIGTLGGMVVALTVAFGVLIGSLSILFLAGMIQGIFSRTNPVAQAAIGDMSGIADKVKNMGYLQCAICLGAFIGPIIGGFFAKRFFFSTLNFSLPFFIAALFAAIGVFLTLKSFQETLAKKTNTLNFNTFSWSSIKKILANKEVQMISLILFTTQFTWSMYYQSISPILKQRFYFSAGQLGFFMGLIAIWLVLTSGVSLKILEKFLTFNRLFILSLSLMFFGCLLSLFASAFHLTNLIWFASFPVAMGDLISYVYLVTLYSNAVSSSEQGKVMGISFMIISITWALTGILSGILLGMNILFPLVVAPFSILFSFLFISSKVLNIQESF